MPPSSCLNAAENTRAASPPPGGTGAGAAICRQEAGLWCRLDCFKGWRFTPCGATPPKSQHVYCAIIPHRGRALNGRQRSLALSRHGSGQVVGVSVAVHLRGLQHLPALQPHIVPMLMPTSISGAAACTTVSWQRSNIQAAFVLTSQSSLAFVGGGPCCSLSDSGTRWNLVLPRLAASNPHRTHRNHFRAGEFGTHSNIITAAASGSQAVQRTPAEAPAGRDAPRRGQRAGARGVRRPRQRRPRGRRGPRRLVLVRFRQVRVH